MCIPSLNQPVITDSDISSDGTEPLLIGKLKPVAPKGYVARFIEGRWQIVQDPSFQGGGGAQFGGKGAIAERGGCGGGSGGGGMTTSGKG